MDTMMEEPIRLKAELAKTREVIAKKFWQSQKERLKRERAIDETFVPAIETIVKMVNEGEDGDQGAIDEFKKNMLDGGMGVENKHLSSKKRRPTAGKGGRPHKRALNNDQIVGGSGENTTPENMLVEEESFIPYNQNIVYEYYDDPNDLCNRLRLLMSSQGAGNTNHNQEINSILGELYERGIIL